jgi:predicted dehydrogenase
VNWRLYTKYSKGLLSELCCHQIHAVNWFLDRAPVSVMGTGGIHRYDDGRELNDHDYAIFEYPGRVTLSYSSIQSNAFDHYYEEFMGTRGTIVLSGEREAMLFMGAQGSAATQISVTPPNGEPLLEASESRSRDAAGSAAIGQSAGAASALAPYRLELEGFACTIQNGDSNLCDGNAGFRAALPIVKAREAIGARTRLDITWPPDVTKT